jgi:dihydrofolate reductase
MIGIIAAVDYNGLIGYDGKLPWHSPEDLKRFRELTLNSNVLMGRKTYDSIGRPLPNRNNYILTSRPSSILNIAPSLNIISSLDDALKSFKDSKKSTWIIGGAEIYQAALKTNQVEIIDLTIIQGIWEPPNGMKEKCVYFPMIPYNYSVQSEKINANDDKLLHRRYILRTS